MIFNKRDDNKLFNELDSSYLINFQHHENDYVDFDFKLTGVRNFLAGNSVSDCDWESDLVRFKLPSLSISSLLSSFSL